MKKTLFTICYIMAALSLLMVGCKPSGSGENAHKGELLALLYDSEQWGFIDRKGNYVADPQFNALKAFACEDGYGVVLSSRKAFLINLKNGTTIEIPVTYNVVAKRMVVSLPGEHSYSPSRAAILSVDGEVIVPPTNSKATKYYYSDSDNSLSEF